MKQYDKKNGIIHWDIPYESGELRVEGCDDNGQILSSYVIKSSERPYAIRVRADRDLSSVGQTILHLLVEIVDEHGVLVKLADNEITCHVEGPARLLGLENGNNRDMSEHRDNSQRVWHGKLLAYVQTTKENGQICIRFTSPLLVKDEIVLNIN